MYNVEITAEAEKDLQAAFSHIAEGSIERAEKWRRGLYEKADALATFPHRCGIASEATAVGCEIRELLYGNYRLLFAIQENSIYITHIRHGARKPLTGDEVRRLRRSE